MKKLTICFAITVLTATATFAQSVQPTRMSDLDFLVNFRTLSGQLVTIESCVIEGTTIDFIRCATMNGAEQIAIETKTLNQEDLRFSYENCPTGVSRSRPRCKVVVTGVVTGKTVPWITNARFEKR